MQTNDECAVKQQSRMKLDGEKQIETTFYTLILKNLIVPKDKWRNKLKITFGVYHITIHLEIRSFEIHASNDLFGSRY